MFQTVNFTTSRSMYSSLLRGPVFLYLCGGGHACVGGTPVHAPMRTPLPVSLNKTE